MSRRATDNANWGGGRPGAGRPKSGIDKDGRGFVWFKLSQWVYKMPVKRLTDESGVVVKDGKEIPVVYFSPSKIWYEHGCIKDRVLEAEGALLGGMLLDEKGMPLTKVAEERLYGN